jgi:hypothetical protein
MKINKGSNIEDQFPILRELMWIDKYVYSSKNILICNNCFFDHLKNDIEIEKKKEILIKFYKKIT